MSTTLTVYLRAYTPLSDCQEEVVARARALGATGRVDDYAFSEWPATANLAHDCEPVDVYRRVRDWAETNGLGVHPPFRVHTRVNHATGAEDEVLHTPVVYLTLERDDRLAAVAPCTLPGGTHLTARDLLDAIQDRRDPFADPENEALSV